MSVCLPFPFMLALKYSLPFSLSLDYPNNEIKSMFYAAAFGAEVGNKILFRKVPSLLMHQSQSSSPWHRSEYSVDCFIVINI